MPLRSIGLGSIDRSPTILANTSPTVNELAPQRPRIEPAVPFARTRLILYKNKDFIDKFTVQAIITADSEVKESQSLGEENLRLIR